MYRDECISVGIQDIAGADDFRFRVRLAELLHIDVVVFEDLFFVFRGGIVFIAFFLSIRDRTMHIADGLNEGDYLLCRWRIQPVKLVPPLTLMTIFRSDLQVISSWKRTDFERVSP